MAEDLVLSSNRPSFKTCALRSAPIFGPHDPVTIPTIHGCIAKGETPFILGSGMNLQDYVYVTNVADAHILAIQNLRCSGTAAGEAFFITNGEPVTVRDLCLAIWKEFDHFPRWELTIPEKPAWWLGWGIEWVSWMVGTEATFSRGIILDATKNRYVSIAKARRLLGYEPRVSLPDALKTSCQVSVYSASFSQETHKPGSISSSSLVNEPGDEIYVVTGERRQQLRATLLPDLMWIKRKDAIRVTMNTGHICRLRSAMCVMFRAVSIVLAVGYLHDDTQQAARAGS